MSSMFFILVMTSSCCPGTARLPVCRGVVPGVEGRMDDREGVLGVAEPGAVVSKVRADVGNKLNLCDILKLLN
jgi:hypothetical protein